MRRITRNGHLRTAAWSAILGLLPIGCGPVPPAYDLRRPQVIEVTPASGASGIDPEAPVELLFDEPVGPLEGTHVVLVPAAAVTPAFRADLDSGGLGTRSMNDTVPCIAVALEGARRVRLEHPPLEHGVVYALLASADLADAARNSLAGEDGGPSGFEARFTTAHAGAVATLIAPDPGAGPVPPNLPEVLLEFDRELQGLSAEAVRVEDATGRLVPGEAFLSADHRRIRRIVAQPLDPGVRHAVVLGHLVDVSGTRATGGPWGFDVAACVDERPPEIREASVAPLDYTATVTVRADEPGAATVRLRALGACAGEPAVAPVVAVCGGAVDPCGHPPAPGGCIAELTLRDLCSESRYEATPIFTDAAGHVVEGAALSFRTLEPSARPTITEVLVDATAPEEGGEFVELFNESPEPWDLAGWLLVKVTGTGETPRTLAPRGGGSAPLPGHATAVYASRSFEAARYGGLPQGAILLDGVTSSAERSVFGNGLSNANPPRLELRGPDGGVLASWPAGAKCPEGKSAARLPGGDAAPVCGAPTPGAL